MKRGTMPVSVHLASTDGMQLFENAEGFFCLRSKRSVVRIHSGVPIFHRLTDTHLQNLCAVV